MGISTEHETPDVEYKIGGPIILPRIGDEPGALGRIFRVLPPDADPNDIGYLAQVVQAGEMNDVNILLVDPSDGVVWNTDGDPGAYLIKKRYNARLVLTEVK